VGIAEQPFDPAQRLVVEVDDPDAAVEAIRAAAAVEETS
jgi:hypothetical protein